MSGPRNHVKLIGKVSFDPEVREIAKGRLVARLSLVTNETYRNKEGEMVTDTQWHTVVAWGSMAQVVTDKIKKGMSIALDGRLVHRSYTGKDGEKRYVTEVLMSSFNILSVPLS